MMPAVSITTSKIKETADDVRKQIVHHVSDGETTVMISSVEEIDQFEAAGIDLSILDIPQGYILHESMGFYVQGSGKVNWGELFCLRPADHKQALKIVQIAFAAKHVGEGEDVMFVNKDE